MALAAAVAAVFSTPALANPTGPVVTHGSALLSHPAPNVLQVVNSPGAIINWQGFSIGSGETTRFLQQSAASAVLNRVTGADPSSILGTLSSNGRVFLVNPHGIVFGAGSRIDTAGFIASTLNLSDQDFLAGRLRFEGGGHGVLKNEGAIRAGGDIFLVGPQIENAGAIRSDAGSVMLAAGRSVTITSPDAHGVQFALQAPEDRAVNLGAISAANAAGLFAGTLRHSGDIRAVDVRTDAAGKVILAAQKDAIVEGGATIHADSATGKGGSVRITGERVGLFDTATVTARGAAGGGEILAGGDYRGANPEVRNAAITHVAPGATLDASATASGDGGRVIVWADDTTRVHGSVFARGGAQGGAGGFIETSGKRYLDVSGINVSAAGQTPGSWLLDPLDIEVVAGAGTVNNGGAPAFTPGGGSSQIGADLIVGQLDAGTSVTLNTNVAGADAGDITINAPIVKTVNNAASLNLTANNDIAVNANITLPNASAPGETASVTLNAGGDVTVNDATVQAGSVFVTAGGAIQRSGAQANDFLYGGTGTGDGALHLTANGGAIGAAGNPVRMQNNRYAGTNGRGPRATTTHDSGDIHLRYTGSGLYFDVANAIQTSAGTTQAVQLEHTGTGTVAFYSAFTGNDDWTIDSAGNYGFAGTTLTANSVNATFGGSTGRLGVYPLLPAFDTSAVNGNISITARDIEGTGCGGSQVGVGVKPGTGLVSATATAPNAGCGGSIQLMHFGGDLLTSRYTLNFSNAAVPGNYMRLKAADGHLVVDSTAGFNASLNNKDTLLQTLTAGKDIVFQGGTVQGGRVEVRAARNVDNLAPGTDGFIQTNAFGGPHWMLVAGGGIGLTNPVEGRADWVGSLMTSGAGAAGDIRVKFTGGATPRIGEIRTPAGSAQNINVESTVGLVLSPAQPGFGGALGGGTTFVTANDHYTVNAANAIFFDGFDNSITGDTMSVSSGGSIVHGGNPGNMVSATGLITMNANGGSIGSAGTYARLRGGGPHVLHALNDVYVDAGSNPLSLAGISTGPGAGTIGLRTTAANNLTLGGTANLNDALVLDIGGNILFPAAASFTTSGGLTLNSPTQIAATASVNVTGGVLTGTGAVSNAGTFTKGNAGATAFAGGLTNSGTVNVNAGTLDLAGGYTDAGGLLKLGGGSVTAPAGGLVLNTGLLGGVGTVTGNVTHNGTMNVGASPGTMTIAGDLTLGPASVLNIELGGTNQGVDYDLLQVTGTANLGGTLNVSLFGGFTGSVGDTFDVITYAGRTGDFVVMNQPTAGTLSANPNASFYRLAIATPPASGSGASTGSTVLAPLAVGVSQNELTFLNQEFIKSNSPTESPSASLGSEPRSGPALALHDLEVAAEDEAGNAGGGKLIFANPSGFGGGSTKEIARRWENQRVNEGEIILRNEDYLRDRAQLASADSMHRTAQEARIGEYERLKAEGRSSFEAAEGSRKAAADAVAEQGADSVIADRIAAGELSAEHLQGLNARQGLNLSLSADKAAQQAGLHGGSGHELLKDVDKAGKLDEIKAAARNFDPTKQTSDVNDIVGGKLANEGFRSQYGMTLDQLQNQQMRGTDSPSAMLNAAGSSNTSTPARQTSSQSPSNPSSQNAPVRTGNPNENRPDSVQGEGRSSGPGTGGDATGGSISGSAGSGGQGGGGAGSGPLGPVGPGGHGSGGAGAAPNTPAQAGGDWRPNPSTEIVYENPDGTWTLLVENGDGTFTASTHASENEAYASAEAARGEGGSAGSEGASNSNSEGSSSASNSTTENGTDGSEGGSTTSECTGDNCSEGNTESSSEGETTTADAGTEGSGRPNPMSDGPANVMLEIFLDVVFSGGHGTRQQMRAIEGAAGGNVTNPGDNPNAVGTGGTTSPQLDAKNINLATGGGVGGGRAPLEPEAYNALDEKSILVKSGGAVTDPPKDGSEGGGQVAPAPFLAGPTPIPTNQRNAASFVGAVIETTSFIKEGK